MKHLLIAGLAIFIVSHAGATILRVSNAPGSTATFNDINAAMVDALPGDTLMIEPWQDPGLSVSSDSLLGYAPAVIATPVFILGNGYFNDQLFPNGASTGSSRIQRLSLLSTATGSVIHGVDAAKIQVGANGVTVRHSRIQRLRLRNCVNAKIEFNFIEGGYLDLPAFEVANSGAHIVGYNIIIAHQVVDDPQYCVLELPGILGINYDHNVFEGGLLLLEDANIGNSIFSDALLQDFNDATIQNCIFSLAGVATEFDSADAINLPGSIAVGNAIDIDLSTVFLGTSTSIDGSYDIQPGSIADGTGLPTGNIGAYSVNGYLSGGFGIVPVVMQFSTAASDQNSCYIPITFQLDHPDAIGLSYVEVYVDVDPGFGQGVSTTLVPGSSSVSSFMNVSLVGLAPGEHILGIRTRDASGIWSLPVEAIVIKDQAQDPTDLQDLKAFWDQDPGYGEEQFSFPASAADDDGNLSQVLFEEDILPQLDFNPGLHTLHFRGIDQEGTPGVTYVTQYLVFDDPEPAVPLESLRAFWDDDPGYGDETFFFAISTDAINELFDAEILLAGLAPGPHTLYWRSYDQQGNMSVTHGTMVVVQDIQPEVALAGLEYFWDEDDPGYGEATQFDAPVAGLIKWDSYFNNAPPSVTLNLGPHTLTVRSVDVEGNWSVSVQRDVEVVDELVIIDVNGDGQIVTADLLAVMAAFTCNVPDPGCSMFDLNFSTVVTSADILMVLANFGVSY